MTNEKIAQKDTIARIVLFALLLVPLLALLLPDVREVVAQEGTLAWDLASSGWSWLLRTLSTAISSIF